MKEALKLALEALENHCGNYKLDDEGVKRYIAACNAIKEALAQPDRPVKTYHEGKPVYVSQPEQEPVAWKDRTYGTLSHQEWQDADPLYTTPPKRPWVGLTDEDISLVLRNLQVMYNRPPTTDSRAVFARAIEAKLKEKNT